MAKRDGKSKKYPGVYWYMVDRLDGKGPERLYYILYRRSSSRKQIEDKLGRASEGWTEGKANQERAQRMMGGQSNAEKRQQEIKERLTGGGPVTVDRLWQIYEAAHLGNKSIRDDRNRYNKHIGPQLGQTLACGLASADIERLRAGLEKYGLSPQSVKHCLGLVKRILSYGAKVGAIVIPAGLYFNMPKFDNRKTESMTAEQLAAYWRALDEEADQDAVAILRLALLTGMRRGALFGLRWEDVDLEHALITLRAESAKSGKTSILPLNQASVSLLAALPRTSEYVFPGQNGGRRKTFQKISQRVRERAGLPKDFRPMHALRHVFASMLASSGKVDVYTLQKLMTHGSMASTQRYAHLADEALRRGIACANMLVGEKEDE